MSSSSIKFSVNSQELFLCPRCKLDRLLCQCVYNSLKISPSLVQQEHKKQRKYVNILSSLPLITFILSNIIHIQSHPFTSDRLRLINMNLILFNRRQKELNHEQLPTSQFSFSFLQSNHWFTFLIGSALITLSKPLYFISFITLILCSMDVLKQRDSMVYLSRFVFFISLYKF